MAVKEWAAAELAISEWLTGIADAKGLHPAIRYSVARLLGDRSETLVKWRDHRSRDRASSVSVLNTWRMAGGT